MKGLNVKKIAALAAGAVFLGSAVAGAALMSDLAPNTTLVNDNGVPQVTVLIPEAGAASDGVAGARIAAKIAYEAYTTKTYTADFSGTPQCEGTGEGGETTTTCAVEGQSVTLQIEAPGVAGIYEFSPLIYDVFDKELGDREVVNDHFNDAEHKDEASPFYTTSGNDVLYRIGDEFFEDYNFAVSGMNFIEKERVFIEGMTNIDTPDGKPYGDIDKVIYSVKFFKGSQTSKNGLPVCIDDQSGDWAYCAGTNPDKEVAEKQVYINFLGENDWVITDMQAPSTTIGNEDDRARGGSITLAKEMVPAQVLHIGDTIAISDSLTLKLTDITYPAHSGYIPNAAVEILGPGGDEDVLEELNIPEGTTEDYEAPDGTTYKIHVYDAVPGLGVSRWAKITVYSHEWTLTDGEELDEPNDDWEVQLYWKDTEGSGTSTADALREILLVNDDIDDMHKDDSVYILSGGDSKVYQLTYNGLTDEPMTTLRFYFDKLTKAECGCSSNCDVDTSSTKHWLVIDSGSDEYTFTESISGSGNEGTKMYISLDSYTPDSGVTGGTGSPLDLWVYDNDDGCMKYAANFGGGTLTLSNYDPLGDLSTTGIQIQDNMAGGYSASDGDYLTITVTEEIGDVDNTPNTATYTFYVYTRDISANDWDLVRDGTGGAPSAGGPADGDAEARYVAPGSGNWPTGFPSAGSTTTYTVADGFVSLRGTELDLSNDEYKFKLPLDVKHMQFSFTPVGSATNPNITNWTAVEGDSRTFNDVTITVLSIDPDTVSCGVTGTGSAECTYVEGSAVPIIKETGTPTVDAIVKPASDPSWQNLVMLDTQASGISGNFIAVGGPVVNTVTARELGDADRATLESQKVLIKEVAPTKIIVAGWEAEDTLTAADQFIASMKRV